MMRVGLLRHGEVNGGSRFRGHTDDALTSIGLQQMRAATDGRHWSQVVSSPLVRCAAFANAFARQHSLPLTFDPRLREMHFGMWEGRSASELMAEDPEALTRFWRDPDSHPPPGGEPLAGFQARVLDAWKDLTSGRIGKRVLVVTHGGVIRILLCHVFAVPVPRWHEFDVPHGKLHGVHIGGDGLGSPACKEEPRW